jgi:hypothetical protein
MAITPRIPYTNLVQAAAAILSASSAQGAFPVRRLRDQLRSATWRSAIGWTIVAGFNDKIDFNRGGVKVATIAAGTYATGAALATAIVTALEAADATPVWACSYSGSTFKFTISSDLAFTLLWGTGANAATDVAIDIGFAETDTSSLTSHTGANAVYQSRHYIGVDQGSSIAITAAIVINHNAGTGGTFKFQRSVTSVIAAATVPGDAATLAGDASIRIAFFGSGTHRYLALVINDVGNTAGYGEVGIFFAGTYAQPSVVNSDAFADNAAELSMVEYGDHGATFRDEKPQPGVFPLEWLEVPEADRTIFKAIRAATPQGKSFFFTFDSADPTVTVYCERLGELTIDSAGPAPSGSYWTVRFTIKESLG